MTLGKPGEPQRQSRAITWSLLRGRLGQHTDKERQLEEERGRFEDAGLRMRVMQLKQRRPTAPHPRSWKKQESFSSEASGGSTTLPTLGFQPIDTDVGCQASRIIRIHICCLKPTSLWSREQPTGFHGCDNKGPQTGCIFCLGWPSTKHRLC